MRQRAGNSRIVVTLCRLSQVRRAEARRAEARSGRRALAPVDRPRPGRGDAAGYGRARMLTGGGNAATATRRSPSAAGAASSVPRRCGVDLEACILPIKQPTSPSGPVRMFWSTRLREPTSPFPRDRPRHQHRLPGRPCSRLLTPPIASDPRARQDAATSGRTGPPRGRQQPRAPSATAIAGHRTGTARLSRGVPLPQ
jgi:hypothetical protein